MCAIVSCRGVCLVTCVERDACGEVDFVPTLIIIHSRVKHKVKELEVGVYHHITHSLGSKKSTHQGQAII